MMRPSRSHRTVPLPAGPLPRLLPLCALALLLPGGPVRAAVPAQLNHEGLLLDADGLPMVGQVALDFALYREAQGGQPRWTQSETLLLVDGYYRAALGREPGLAAELAAGLPLYLEIRVQGAALSPRQPLLSVPYALLADNATGHITPATITVGGELIVDEHGNWVGPPVPGVGEGYTTPAQVLAALKGVDGAGSGLDADLLDGADSAVFVRDDELDLLLQGLGGPGSGLDADLLDGVDATDFMRVDEDTGTVGSLLVGGNLEVGGDAVLGGGLALAGDLALGGALEMGGDAVVSGSLLATQQLLGDTLWTQSGVETDGDLWAGGELWADGNLGTGANLHAVGEITGDGNLAVAGDVRAGGELYAEGPISTGQQLQAAGPISTLAGISAGGNLSVAGGISSGGVIQAGGGVRIGEPDALCNAAREKLLRWDGEQLVICIAGQWKPVAPPAAARKDGTTQERAGYSCLSIKTDGFGVANGVYWIDPTGGSTADAFQVYCDMTSDGGGWAKVLHYRNEPWAPNRAAVGSIAVAGTPAFAKLSDAQINSIGGNEQQGGSGQLKIYRIYSTQYTSQRVYMRTRAVWDDLGRGMGLMAQQLDVCQRNGIAECGWSTINYPWIDTLHWGLAGNDGNRYFADHDQNPQCYNPRDNSRRCFCSGSSINNHYRIDDISIWVREVR